MTKIRGKRGRLRPALWLALGGALLTGLKAQNFTQIRPSPQQAAWQDLEFGVILHFGPNTFLNQEWGNGTASPRVFNPRRFDPGQWMRAIRAAGAKYVIFVAKHHDGFCLWPTAQTDYSVKSSPFEHGHGDVVGAVERAARKYGLKFGLYLSPWDRHDPRYQNSAAYDRLYEAEMTELITRYGPLAEWWLDGAGSAGHVYNFPAYLHLLREYQPNTLVFADVNFMKWGDIRWVGNEGGIAPRDNWDVIDRTGYLRWRPAECDTPLHRRQWFWHPHDGATLKTLPELLATYERTVGRGCQLMLGVAPDAEGRLPRRDAQRLRQFGAALRRIYGHNLAPTAERVISSAGGQPRLAADNDAATFWMPRPGVYAVDLELRFRRPVTFDRAVTMEWLNRGQEIERYEIQAEAGPRSQSGGGWRTLARGTSIGHKRINRFARTTATRVRLRIQEAAGRPAIREFQLYDGQGAP